MILRSGKIPIKRPRRSSANSDEITADFINRLPDALLIEILSLLPEADAYSTRILSSRWKNLCTFLPNQHFVMPTCRSMEKVNKFHDTIDQTLALRGGMPIERFFLDCSKKCNYDRVYDLLVTVVQCTVQKLDLTFPDDRIRVKFCWDLFKTCNTLVGLTLKGQFVLDVPECKLIFPCLKTLSLKSIAYSGEQSFENLIRGCPVLKRLSVVRNFYDPRDKRVFVERSDLSDDLRLFKVVSPSLKRLSIYFYYSSISREIKAVINAPKLEYINIFDIISTDFSFTEPLSLVEAKISKNHGSIVELITCLSSARILTLDNAIMRALSYVDDLNLPMFPNLVELAIGLNWRWDLLLDLLNNMPNLEHITLSYHVLNKIRGLPVEAPACLHFKMKEVIVLNEETVKRDDLSLISYFLEHSINLETFTLNAHEISPKRREQILNFHCGSKLCQVKFV